MIEWIKSLFSKKNLSEDFVDTGIGRIYYKVLTKGVVDDITSLTQVNGNIETNYFLQLMEHKLLDISAKKLRSLPMGDDVVIREKTKEILVRHNVLTIEKEEVQSEGISEFSHQDKKWFSEAKDKGLNKARGMLNG